MKKLLFASLICLSLMFSGCVSIHKALANNGRSAPGGQLKGYGMVNEWMTLTDSNIDYFLKYLSKSGCNMTEIELFGREEDQWINNQSKIKDKFDTFIELARYYNVIVFVDIANQGDTSIISQPDSFFQGWLNFINDYGPGNMVVQAVGEGSGSKSQNWYAMTENTLTKFTLSYNMGARPTSAPTRYLYIDYHSASIPDIGPNDSRIMPNTDSGILNEMQNGGVMGQTFITDKVVQFATPVIAQKRSVNLYGYYHLSPDKNAMSTLGGIK